VRARTSRAPTGSGWWTRQVWHRWHGCRGGIQCRWRGCAVGRIWRRWLRLGGTICRLRLESEEKLRPEILGVGLGILISGPRFVGSAGDALSGLLSFMPEEIFRDVASATSSKEAWDTLLQMFASSTRACTIRFMLSSPQQKSVIYLLRITSTRLKTWLLIWLPLTHPCTTTR
jgi:hypothetical protein